MRTLLPTIAFLALATATVDAEYRRIGEGPTLDYANAYCENAAMGVGGGYGVMGDPAFVGMYALGSSIARAVKQSQFHENCMVMQGWKWTPDAPAQPRRSINQGAPQGSSSCSREQLRGRLWANC